MLRVGDLDRSINFYTNILGMKLLRTTDRPDQKYKLAFLGYSIDNKQSEIELTYNYDTDKYIHGDAFGHIAVGIKNVKEMCNIVKSKGGKITREAGPVKGGKTIIAFIEDPDGYKIELIQII